MTNNLVNEKIQFTASGLTEIQSELELLKTSKLSLAIERLARARDFGDLSENAEYHAAKEELVFIEGRIEELEDIVLRAQVVGNKKSNGVIDIGCKVTVMVGGKEHTYEIVGQWEADPLKKKISHTSPLGQALVGKKKGEAVEFEAPAGKVIYKIKKIQ
ncbi:transcription elongation factor GreA [Candidatus Collierbacteria bacterium CG10_big_fil_rev_8_21_14_0_10_44_9]|uniref:Transcription elongation factor GreA n=1 Tax=Candidatus Collierbacteria bacterium CG10_big_fil_rev_8_21_14_0_10_44_9 TaxID=1974535 RepID=A0A2H0VKH8_9BACT|nr:MAG: transcription elongation factor GreA [Candidatus Collierbacteria bacterium CG10_big_fil_rev_8_21_14_0_10_44_9]